MAASPVAVGDVVALGACAGALVLGAEGALVVGAGLLAVGGAGFGLGLTVLLPAQLANNVLNKSKK